MELKFEDLPETVCQLIDQNKLILKSIQDAAASEGQNEQVLTLSRFCELLELKRQTIYSYVSKRQIPYHKKVGKLYFFKEEIVEWIKSENKSRTINGIKFNSKKNWRQKMQENLNIYNDDLTTHPFFL